MSTQTGSRVVDEPRKKGGAEVQRRERERYLGKHNKMARREFSREESKNRVLIRERTNKIGCVERSS